MRFRQLIQLVALAVIVAVPGATRAAEEQSAGLWHLSHLSDPVTGKFNYCAVEDAYDNGLTLAFARNRDFNTNIVVSFPDKRLQEHSRYKMMVAIDANPVRDMDAFSADSSILVLPLQRDRKLLDWLQKGKLLELKGPQDSVKFSLDGANDAFHKLQACVEQGLKDETARVAQPAKGVKNPQMAEVEAARPMAPDMVQPLPLPAQPPAATPAQVAPSAQVPTPPAVVVPAVAAPSPASAASASVDAALASATAMVSAPPDHPAEPPPPSVPQAAPVTQPVPVPQVSNVDIAAVPAPAAAPPPLAPVQPAPVPAAPVTLASSVVTAPTPKPQSPAPVVSARLPDVSDVLKTASLPEIGSCAPAASQCQWHDGNAGGIVNLVPGRKSLLDTMLDDTDSREKACKDKFTAENGAPAIRNGIEQVQSVYTCGDTVSAAIYARGTDRIMTATSEAANANRPNALQARQKLLAALNKLQASP